MSILMTSINGFPSCIDTEQIPEDPSPILDIALDLSIAGFKGIRFLEFKINATRDGVMVQLDESSHEGLYLKGLIGLTTFPTSEQAIKAVKELYAIDEKGELND